MSTVRRPTGFLFAAATSAVWLGVAAAPLAGQTATHASPAATPFELSAIDTVWSGHSVKSALVVTDTTIFVGYYDANRQLTIASRPRSDGAGWRYQKLDSWVNWDSHNYVAMAVDAAGNIHVSANMHRDPLLYYRTTTPGDVRTLVRVPVMADAPLERSATYPIFLHDAAGHLVFKYRDGASGNGNEIYNIFDAASGRWRHLLDVPLTDGEGQRNAYFVGPVLGPDKRFHIAWVWRESPMAESNHDLSYAQSRDLVHWESSDGKPLHLPITLSTAEIVDRVPAGGGMINNNTVVGFDPAGRAMITFHKFDAAGDTQIYVARRDPAGWTIAQVSQWRGFRWDFRGGGSLDSRLFVAGPVPVGSDKIRVSVIRDGKAIDFLLDARTLKLLAEKRATLLAERLVPFVAIPSEMMLNTVEDSAGSGIALAWPSRPPHRDVPDMTIPTPTVLTLVMPPKTAAELR
ncbi:BNR repeat-containing protein [Sphingomonas sp. BIUV-7]|uniref:BNR repeat-containing protein n=1 Tax=Sphingomonas natans TaxID=3063330 RepID=A0ABT8Y8H6_9SPHN|nr:BNR repeat-containing protein [Sphingomonas sp. BIUV-7]MDO6414631.1 BNR repeat-containing protein [Sphingomonas sp. BIUV-7]